VLTKPDIQDSYGLAPMQEGMLVQHATDAAVHADVEQFDFVLEGHIDCDALQKSLDALVRKYAVLRTIFSFRKAAPPRQIVLKSRAARLQCEDYSCRVPRAAAASVEDFKLRDRQRGFDLSSDMLLRVALLKVEPARQHMILTFSQIILDRSCLGILAGDLFSYYERIVAQSDARIEEIETHPYREYVRWLQAQDRNAAQAYWKTYLEGYRAEAGPPDFDLPSSGCMRHAVRAFSLGEGLSTALAAVAEERRLPVNSLFQAAWGVLLQKYRNSGDVVFGCVVSGRPPGLPGAEGMIGPFMNTQPVRMACAGDEPFAEVASRIQQDALRSAAYGYEPLFEVQCASPLNRRLLDHIVTFEGYPVSEQMTQLRASSHGVRIVDVKVYEQTHHNFNVIAYPGADIRVNLTYNRARYGDEMVDDLERSLRELLAQVAATPDAPVRALRICCEADRSRIVEPLSATGTAYPSQHSLPDLFAEVVRRSPDAVALRYYAQTYSYAQLHERACAVASALRARGIGPGATVGLMTPSCPEMLFGILGTLYCGAAFLPIDPRTSAERVAYMLEEDGSVLCTVEAFRAVVPVEVAACFLDEAGEVQSQRPPIPPPATDPRAPACIVYTSGSTGEPKRCAVSHRDIVRLVRNADYVRFGPEHRILQTGAPTFHAGTFELWGALLNGAQLCLADEAGSRTDKALTQMYSNETGRGIGLLTLSASSR
jgi:non-ribosomal peptide synthetase component F